MKKIYLLSLLVLIFIGVSCKNKANKQPKPNEKHYTVDAQETDINWTAYKTTKKIPVKGVFTKVIIDSTKNALTPFEALNKLEFKIPISSLFTKDTIRDGKLKKFFFGTMKNTDLISGTIYLDNETSGTVNIRMNGISQALPINYIIKDQLVTIEALMDLENWKAKMAIEALNSVCKTLHSGDDGISKTWSEVKIEVNTLLKYE